MVTLYLYLHGWWRRQGNCLKHCYTSKCSTLAQVKKHRVMDWRGHGAATDVTTGVIYLKHVCPEEGLSRRCPTPDLHEQELTP